MKGFLRSRLTYLPVSCMMILLGYFKLAMQSERERHLNREPDAHTADQGGAPQPTGEKVPSQVPAAAGMPPDESEPWRVQRAAYLSERLGRPVGLADVDQAECEWRSRYLTRDFGFYVPPTEDGIRAALAEANRRYREGGLLYRIRWNWRLRWRRR